jgi:hypothetical protein
MAKGPTGKAGARVVVFFFSGKQRITVGLEEASESKTERIESQPSHGVVEGGARSEAERTAITTICS